MYLKEIRFITLKRRPDKMWSYVGAMVSHGWYAGMLKPMEAKDGQAYESAQELCAAAVEDGFSEFGHVEDDWIEEAPEFLNAEGARGSLACMWSMKRQLREVAEGDDPLAVSICMTDNTYGLVSQDHVGEAIDKLPDSFEMLQCFYRLDDSEKTIDVSGEEWEDEETGLMRGLRGMGDNAMAVSPQGARTLLEIWGQRMYCKDLLEFMMLRLARYQTVEGPRPYAYHPKKPWFKDGISLVGLAEGPDSERLSY